MNVRASRRHSSAGVEHRVRVATWDAKGRRQEHEVHLSPTSSKRAKGHGNKRESRTRSPELSSNSIFVGELKSKTAKLLRSPLTKTKQSGKKAQKRESPRTKLQRQPSSRDATSLDRQQYRDRAYQQKPVTAKAPLLFNTAITENQGLKISGPAPILNLTTPLPTPQLKSGNENSNSVYVPGHAPVARKLYELHQVISRKELQLANGSVDQHIKDEIVELRAQLNGILNTFANQQSHKVQPPVLRPATNTMGKSGSYESPLGSPKLTSADCATLGPSSRGKCDEQLDHVEINHHLCSACGKVRGPDFHASYPKLQTSPNVQNLCAICRQKPITVANLSDRHFCTGCGIVRSKAYQKENPKMADEASLPNYCRHCQRLAAKSADIYEQSVISSVSSLIRIDMRCTNLT